MVDEKVARSLVSKAEDQVINAMEILEELAKKGHKFQTECYEATEKAMNELGTERFELKNKNKEERNAIRTSEKRKDQG